MLGTSSSIVQRVAALIAAIILITAVHSDFQTSTYAAQSNAAQSKPSYWAEQDVKEAAASGLSPDWASKRYRERITRVEFAEMILLLYEALTGTHLVGPVSNPFQDTRNFYAAQGYKLGLMNGTGRHTFSPNALITREQIAVMLYNTLSITKLSEQLQPLAHPAFADESKMSPWAEKAITSLAASGLIQGSIHKEKVYFLPKQPTTVEQAVVLVNRIYKKLGKMTVASEKALLTAAQLGMQPNISDKRVQAIYDKAKSVLAQVIRPGMSDYEKELTIHDYLVLNIAYDQFNYERDTVPKDSYSAYGAFMNGIAVCQGYANAANLLLNLAGIEAHIVTGTVNGEAHAWNKVKLAGEYYNLDVTWDDPVPDVAGRIHYGYFNVTDEELRQDHSWGEDNLPPALGTTYNFHVMNGLVAASQEDFDMQLEQAIYSMIPMVTIKRAYTREKDVEKLKAFIFNYTNVASFDCAFGSGGVVTIHLRYQ